MSYLFKDFLSLEDVGEYLNQYGYSYDPEMQADYYKLKDTILDLYNEKKLNIVFHYNDFAVMKTLRVAENLGIEEVEDEAFEFYISGYFHVENPTPIFKNESKLVIRDGVYFYYFLYDKDTLPIYDDANEYKHEAGRKFTSIEFGDNIEPTVIDFCDLRYPKADLDKLFSTKNDELNSVKDELAEVKAKNAKLVADIKESKTTGNFSMGTPTVAYSESETNEQLINKLEAANDQIARLKSQLEQSTTDRRYYKTPAMNIMDKVITEFWIDYNPNQSAPKQEVIVRWITGNFDGVSKALALNIDKVCRHSEARSGGKYKR